VGRALQDQLVLLGSRGFKLSMIRVDPQKSVAAVQSSFPDIAFDTQGVGDHLAKADTKIRRVKEICRSVLASWPYQLPSVLVKDLVTYAVNRINVRRTVALTDNRVPRVLFTVRGRG